MKNFLSATDKQIIDIAKFKTVTKSKITFTFAKTYIVAAISIHVRDKVLNKTKSVIDRLNDQGYKGKNRHELLLSE